MPKWISVEVRSSGDQDTPPPPPDKKPESGPAPAAESSSGAGVWIASIVATLLVIGLAAAAWWFFLRPQPVQTASPLGAPQTAAGAAAPAGVGVPAPLDDLPAVVATVNGESITREQLTQLIRINQALYPITNGSEVVLDANTLQTLRASLLEQMVNNRIELSAAKAAGVTVNDADVESEFAQFKTVYRVDDARLEQSLTRYGLTSKDIKTWLRDSAMVNRFLVLAGQESAKAGKPFSREAWLNDQLVTADVNINLTGAQNNAPLKVGEAPPDFQLKDLNGKTWTLAELRGKPVIINFWATWCAPCKFEMPLLEAAYKKYKDQGLVVLAVDIKTDNGEAAVRKYVQDMGLTFPIPVDSTGDAERNYRVRAYPTTYFVSRDGKLREIKRGAFINADQLNVSVDKIMQQQ